MSADHEPSSVDDRATAETPGPAPSQAPPPVGPPPPSSPFAPPETGEVGGWWPATETVPGRPGATMPGAQPTQVAWPTQGTQPTQVGQVAPPMPPPPPPPPAAPPAAPPSPAVRDGALPPPPLPPVERSGWSERPGPAVLPPSPPLREPAPTTAVDALPPLPGGGTTAPAGPSRPGIGLLLLTSLLTAFVAAVLTAVVVTALDDDPAATSSAPNRLAGERLDIQQLLTKAQPSVVAIQTADSSLSSLYGGAGTGLVISEDGYVLTNAHVIASSPSVTVTLFDGSEHAADLVGSFPDDDIALVKVTDTDTTFTPAELGSSDAASVGDDVVAIGNALNLGGPPSVTEGIISATDRTIETTDFVLRGLIQTDAAINPGNSGGPLLNAQGQVIGLNTAIISDAQNIGFAIPIDDIKPLIDELKQGRGTITPDTAFLGVVTESVADVPEAVLDEAGVTASRGAFVSEVAAGSAAETGGLAVGDVIVGIDDEPIETKEDVGEIIRSRSAGDEITVEYEREGRRESVTVTLGTRLGG